MDVTCPSELGDVAGRVEDEIDRLMISWTWNPSGVMISKHFSIHKKLCDKTELDNQAIG